ncbi:MAG: dTDP-4-dehydrorhamnose reductase [Spirochaetes bacterium]|nr:dTDP-4-dehydrorhamnose reductase [Spirochaetota bacterium]
MVWVIGANGMLGQTLTRILKESHIPFLATDMEVDITDKKSLSDYCSSNNSISWIINCSAYTNVDGAESEDKTAYQINHHGAANIAGCAKDMKIPLIHISTDYVFDGNDENPKKETDSTGPISVYGKSKLAGELALQEITGKYFIIRTAWLYGIMGNNFVKTMLRLMNEKDQLNIVNDQIGSPTLTIGLAKVIVKIIQDNSKEYGIYHYSDEGEISWYDFACEIYKQGKQMGLINNTVKINPVPSSAYPTPAKRPAFSLMDKTKIKTALDIKVKDWKENLITYLNLEKDNK